MYKADLISQMRITPIIYLYSLYPWKKNPDFFGDAEFFGDKKFELSDFEVNVTTWITPEMSRVQKREKSNAAREKAHTETIIVLRFGHPIKNDVGNCRLGVFPSKERGKGVFFPFFQIRILLH